MSRKTLNSLQYENMSKMVNSFLYEYRCQMEIRQYNYEKTIYERDPENRRKRALVKKECKEKEYLIVTGNGCEPICSVSGGCNKDFEIFIYPKLPWKDKTPDITASSVEDATREIEKICRLHYFKKYGETIDPYGNSPKRRTFKRLSVGEICDWYNQFRRTDMTIEDMQEALLVKKEFKESGLSIYDVKKALRLDKKLRQIYNKRAFEP